MSPTVFHENGFRFFFFSREGNRKHVHVYCSDGEANLMRKFTGGSGPL